MLGLAVGDAAGLPFELRRGARARAQYHRLRAEDDRFELAKALVKKRVQQKGPTPFARTFSDDTTCCDLKMEAAVQASRFGKQAGEETLQLAVLQQYLKWAHGSKMKDGIGSAGELFQGTGGFTQDFLVPFFRGRKNEVARVLGHNQLFEDHPELGPYWPTAAFASFAGQYFQGVYSFPSWGNGAVMSFAPHPVLAGRWRRGPPSGGGAGEAGAELQDNAAVLSRSHQEPTAKLAGEWLWELLDTVYSGAVGSPEDLRRVVANLPKTLDILTLDHECVPVAAFKEWLEHGDCSPSTAEAFLRELTRSHEAFDLESGPHGVFGALLHIAADWNDDHKTFLKRADSKEPVLFSQRGLNSVIIAIWASAGAKSPWQAVSRVIYVGGDTDTVGAVAGQVAFPLMDPAEVVDAFVDFVAVGSDPKDVGLKVANAAAKRYFRRAVLFAAGAFEELRTCPSLLDANYPPVSAAAFKENFFQGLDE